MFGFLHARIKRTSSLSVCCVDTTKHFTRCAGSSVIMGKSPRPSTSNRRISSFSPAWPLISCRTALCLPKTSRAMSQYIRSRSSRGVPRAIASAIIPPVETPPMRSNSSWMGLPAARSSARSCQISVRPFIPPPLEGEESEPTARMLGRVRRRHHREHVALKVLERLGHRARHAIPALDELKQDPLHGSAPPVALLRVAFALVHGSKRTPS